MINNIVKITDLFIYFNERLIIVAFHTNSAMIKKKLKKR